MLAKMTNFFTESKTRSAEATIINLDKISDIVLDFVKIVEQDPKRFRTCRIPRGWMLSEDCVELDYYDFHVWDKKTGIWWDSGIVPEGCTPKTRNDGFLMNHKRSSYKWLNRDEKLYLYNKITDVYDARKDRAEKLKKVKAARKVEQEKRELRKIYKGVK